MLLITMVTTGSSFAAMPSTVTALRFTAPVGSGSGFGHVSNLWELNPVAWGQA